MLTIQRRTPASMEPRAESFPVARALVNDRTESEKRRWTAAIVRLAATWTVALAATLATVALTLHAPTSHLMVLATFLLEGGVASMAVVAGALWLTRDARMGGVRVKFALPVLLTAVIISLNVLLVAQRMFLSADDTRLVLAILVFGVLVAVSLAGSIGASIAAAIRRVELAARRMAAGDYSFRVPEYEVNGATEVARLGRWFNQMAASIEDAFARRDHVEQERRQFVAAISHDLRTPLASVRAMSEAINDGVVSDPITVARYQRTILTEVRHLSLLIDDLFELSRLDAGAPSDLTLHRETVALEDVISDTLEALREQAGARGIALSGVVAGELTPVAVDVRQIHRVLANLAHNALRHTPPGGRVVIHAQPDERAILVRILDDGEGIASRDLPHIFEPSFRGEASRRREHDVSAKSSAPGESLALGAGLGLTIARGLVAAHGGRMWAESPLAPAHVDLLRDGSPGDSASPTAGPGACVSFTVPLDGVANTRRQPT